MRAHSQELPASRVCSYAAGGNLCHVTPPLHFSSCAALAPNSTCSYGPFNYSGTFTTDSNRRFDGWLKSRNALSGIRDFEAVRDAAVKVSVGTRCSALQSALTLSFASAERVRVDR